MMLSSEFLRLNQDFEHGLFEYSDHLAQLRDDRRRRFISDAITAHRRAGEPVDVDALDAFIEDEDREWRESLEEARQHFIALERHIRGT